MNLEYIHSEEITYAIDNKLACTSVFHFVLTRTELVLLDIEYIRYGGITQYIYTIIQEQRAVEMLNLFRRIINMSYCVVDPLTSEVIKSIYDSEMFERCGAQDALLNKLISDSSCAEQFVMGIVTGVNGGVTYG